MSAVSVAIIDPFHPKIVEAIRTGLPPSWRMSVAGGRRPADHAEAMRDAELAFVMATPVPAELISAAPHLGFIQKMGAGVDRIDLDQCWARGIGVARLFAGNATPVAEHTLLLMLASYRRLPLLDRNTRAGRWEKEECRGVNRQISGKTVGIVGFGAIGRAVAKLLSGFGADVVYFDPIPAPTEVEADLKARYLDLDDLLSQADIVTLHLPLTAKTANLLDEGRIGRMKLGALLVNCARGGLVDEAALARALESGRLFGAALDAFSTEPPVGNPLLQMEQTIVTPHAAGATLDNFASLVTRAVENARRYLAGEELPANDLVLPPRKYAHAG